MKTSLFPTITGCKIRIAVVGCRRISKNHFGSIEQHAHDLDWPPFATLMPKP